MNLPSTSTLESVPNYTLLDQERMSKAKRYFAWQGRLVLPYLGRRVVEFGCGTGNFTGMLLDREAVIAVDVEPECLDRLRERYGDRPNLHILPIDESGSGIAQVARFEPDSCVCLNVIEHIEDDGRALRQMASILPSGGVIVLIVPAFVALSGPIDRHLGHYRRYRRASMRTLAADAGLNVEKLRYMNLVGFFGWWMNSRIFHLEIQSSAQIAVFEKCVVPVMSRIESVIAPPFGQSLFAVLRKS